jgi:two-component system, sensor histidine kinase and response regulator
MMPDKCAVKFLLVDDLEENLLVLEGMLRRDDIELLTARSGREALELLLVHDVALALLDVQMPEMDGFELAELMRGTERTRHVPIIFVTAGVREQHRVFQGYDAGAVDFLFKPIEPQILKHKTETFYQLYKQRQNLAAMLRLNEELMAVVGHDLREPLNVILMTAAVLGNNAQDPKAAAVAARLQASGTRMARIIDELLDLARARLGGGIPVERRPTDLLEVAQRAVAELEATNPTRSIRIEQRGNLGGQWDSARLEQVVSNLVGNALVHGSLDQPVRVDLNGTGEQATLSVHSGGHIPSEVLPRLFQPFHAGAGRRGRGGGLGLGLYIVQQIARAHGGSVDVTSDPATGTTFRVRLPRE